MKYPDGNKTRDEGHKFPFIAADLLSCNATIIQALIEGGTVVHEEPKKEGD